MSILICIDPGLRGLGIAAFSEAERGLLCAAYVRSPEKEGRGYAAHAKLAQAAWNWWSGLTPEEVIVEMPQVYPGMPNVDLNDLLDVTGVGAACAVLFGNARHVLPREWKGNVKKEVMTERIRGALLPHELGRIEGGPRHLMHNALDAVGIGLHHYKRLNQKVYPGATP